MSDFRAHIQADLDLGNAKSQMDAFLNQKKKVKLDVDTGSLNSLKDQLNGLGKNTKIKPQVDTSGVKSVAKEFQTIKSLANQMSKTKVKIAGLDTSKNANELKAYQSQLKGMQSQYKDLMNTFGDSFSKSQKGALENIFKGADAKIEVVNAKAKDLANTMGKARASFSKYEAIAAGNKTAQFLKDNTKLSKEYRSVLEDIESKQRSATSRSELTDANKEYRAAISSAKLMGQTGKSFGSEFKRAFGQIGQFVGIYGVIQKGVQTAGQMAKAVLEVDTSMTELRKVSDASDFQLNQQFDKAAVSAQKYGATISDVINTTADWSRLGYGLKDASKLADATTMLQRVGDNMTQESSSEGLISILKGFQKDASEADSIVDKINEVANNEPIDTAGITSALQRSASSLSAAGNTIDESIGMITAANSVVQDPESVGTAFKTMSMRIRGKHKCPSYSNVCPLSQYKLVA